METAHKYDNFPVQVVMLSNLFSISIYGLGFLIMFRSGLILSILYLIYVFILEFKLIKTHCVNCYYWGKTCGFGKGRLSSMFFKKGDISQFCNKEMSWKVIVPDILISLIPIITGIVLIIIKFDLILLAAIVLLILLTTIGNGFIRGSLTCKYCKQRDLGCPADTLFNKK